MSDEIRRVAFHRVLVDEGAGGASAIVNGILGSGVKLLAFSAFSDEAGGSQLDLLPESAEAFEVETKGMGMAMSRREGGFLITGEDPPDAVTETVAKLVRAGIAIASVQYVSSGDDRYGALICVKPPDADRAAELLLVTETEPDAVDEASEESFPASDAPALVPIG